VLSPASKAQNFMNMPCSKQVIGLMSQMESIGLWADTGTFNDQRYVRGISNTDAVVLDFQISKNSVTVFKSRPGILTTYVYEAPKCEAKASTQIQKILASPAGSFTDGDLLQIIKDSKTENKGVMLYFWSPRMQLSIGGVAQAAELAKLHKINFVAVVDELAVALLTPEFLKKYHIESTWLKPNFSPLAKAAKIGLHYPAVMFFRDGNYTGQPRFGYDTESRLTAMLKQVLKL
jgi:hypothetical protein